MICFEWHQLVTTAGLVLDIAGVCVLFVFGLPARIAKTLIDNTGFVVGKPTPGQLERNRLVEEQQSRQRRLAALGHWSGISALVVGFSLQIVGVWMS